MGVTLMWWCGGRARRAAQRAGDRRGREPPWSPLPPALARSAGNAADRPRWPVDGGGRRAQDGTKVEERRARWPSAAVRREEPDAMHEIDDVIQRVEQLFRRVTGHPVPTRSEEH